MIFGVYLLILRLGRLALLVRFSAKCGAPHRERGEMLAVPFNGLRTGYVCLLAPNGQVNIQVF